MREIVSASSVKSQRGERLERREFKLQRVACRHFHVSRKKEEEACVCMLRWYSARASLGK